MRVKLSSLYAGPRGSWGPGICEIPNDIGAEMIEAGVAIPVKMETRAGAPAAGQASDEVETPVENEASDEVETPARSGSRRGKSGN